MLVRYETVLEKQHGTQSPIIEEIFVSLGDPTQNLGDNKDGH